MHISCEYLSEKLECEEKKEIELDVYSSICHRNENKNCNPTCGNITDTVGDRSSVLLILRANDITPNFLDKAEVSEGCLEATQLVAGGGLF